MKDKDHPEHPDLFEKLSKAIAEEEGDSHYIYFGYKIGFHPRQSGLLLWVFQDDKLITRFEHFGIHALGLHRHGTPHSELDPEDRRFAQHLLRFANLNASEGYFFIPKKQVAFFLPKLSRFRKIAFFGSDRAIQFSETPLVPILHLKEQTPNQVNLQASFQDANTGEEFSYLQMKVFIGRRSWAFTGDTFYPIKSSILTPLLEDFDDCGMLTLTGTEAADFIQDYLPLLTKKPEVVLPQGFTLPQVRQSPAEPVFEVSEDPTGEKLILNIQFSYEGHLLPPYQDEHDVLFELQKEGQPILIRRDLKKEKETLQKYYDQGFHRVGLTRFETGGDKALDFISDTLPELEESKALLGPKNLRRFNLVGEVGVSQIKARAVSSGIDWLELEMGFDVGGMEIPYEVVQSLFSQGKRYLQLPGQGFVKIDLESLGDLEEKIADLEGQREEGGRLRLSRFHAAYLDENLKIDWRNHQELGSMIQTLKGLDQIPSRVLPESLTTVLRDYQHHGFDWLNFLHDFRFHGILADDMGLGKTVQALAYLQDQKNRFGQAPNLVLAPTSVVFNWGNEAEKFTPDFKVVLLSGPERKKLHAQIPTADLIVTSYALYRRDVHFLSQQPWRTVILDEAQNIKNYRSKTAQLVKELKAEQRCALTGTPLENRLSELWSIFDFLMPGFLGGYNHFKRKYQLPIENEKSVEHLERLRRRIFPFVMRRLKSEVAKELPPKTEVTNYCEMTGEQHKLYHDVLAACRRQVFSEVEKKGIERSQVSILTALLRLRQVCCHPSLLGKSFHHKGIASGKMDAFKDLVLEVISEGHRILVFSQFVEMLSLLRHWLEEQEIAYEYLDGRTRRREERVKNFNKDSNIPIFLVSLRAGGTGLNLTGADYVIHYDPWWNPAVQDQATDRAHRIGQKKHVFSYKLITKDSVEEKILRLQENKRTLAKGLLSADSALGKRLSFEDLEYLFS